jgi:hypothetical protein
MKKRIEKKMDFVLAEQKQLIESSVLPDPIKPDIGFDQWWEQKRQEKGLKQGLKVAVYKHFQSKGFLDNKEYDLGLRDFGIK